MPVAAAPWVAAPVAVAAGVVEVAQVVVVVCARQWSCQLTWGTSGGECGGCCDPVCCQWWLLALAAAGWRVWVQASASSCMVAPLVLLVMASALVACGCGGCVLCDVYASAVCCVSRPHAVSSPASCVRGAARSMLRGKELLAGGVCGQFLAPLRRWCCLASWRTAGRMSWPAAARTDLAAS